MAIHIKICKSYKEGFWNLRIGNISGAVEMTMLTEQELIREIRDELESEVRK